MSHLSTIIKLELNLPLILDNPRIKLYTWGFPRIFTNRQGVYGPGVETCDLVFGRYDANKLTSLHPYSLIIGEQNHSFQV